jgi:hypothetical protein
MHEIFAGCWWRFSRYEVRDGLIGPAPDAVLEPYAPWDTYRRYRDRPGAGATPYQRLLDLLARIRFEPSARGRPPRLTSDSEASLLSWCGQFGLLGTLLQRVDAVVLAPRWSSPSLEPEPEDGLVAARIRYLRTSEGWQSSRFWEMDATRTTARCDDPGRINQLVLEKLMSDGGLRSFVRIRSLDRPVSTNEPLASTWGNHFPGVPLAERETYAYPLPATEAFWKLYAEPVDEFAIARGRRSLHALTFPASPVLVAHDEGFDQAWSAPSLLGHLALMLLQDMTGHQRLLECEVCQRIRTSPRASARYCSDRCRNTAQKRRQRERKRQGVGC